MDKKRFLQSGLLEQYVLGLTTEEENEEVERYARAFPDIQSEIDLLRKAVRQYAEAEVGLPKGNKQSERPRSNHRNSVPTAPSRGQWLAAACLALFGILGLFYFYQAKSTEAELARLSGEFSTFKEDCQDHQQDLRELERRLSFFQHNQTAFVYLNGTDRAPNLKVRVFWNEEEAEALLQVLSLPKQPRDKQYQIWADINGEMIPLGLIDTDRQTPQAIRCLPRAASLNITLEPRGGSEEPHVDQLYANVALP